MATDRVVNIEPMSPVKQRPPERRYGGVSARERVSVRRERLLDAALDLYGSRGYLATGVKDICREAGLTDRYFYESFADGQELFIATFERTTGDLLELVAAMVAEVPATPRAQVGAAIETFVRALADDPRMARLIFSEPASVGAEAERHMRAALRRFAGLVADTARPHLRRGTTELEIQMGSLSLVGAIERVIVEWQDGKLEATIDQVVRHLSEFFLAVGAAVGVGESA